MAKTTVVWSCAHADPIANNDRFTWLGNLIYDLKPDMCIDLGDGADMRSLNTYDTKYPQAIVNQSYEKDIESYNDSQERLRWKFKHHRKKKPFWVGFEGNHENRIKKAVAHDPRLEGQKYGVSFGHLQTDHWFDEYHKYNNSGPALASYDGVLYSHFISGGNYGTAISGIHHAYSLLSKVGCSVSVGHSHKYGYYYQGSTYPNPTIGHVVGCFKGKEESWAGQANNEWRHGVVIKRNLENGVYDHEFISLKALKEAYG
jgi:hypothetical protein